jgi:hypothetical protein
MRKDGRDSTRQAGIGKHGTKISRGGGNMFEDEAYFNSGGLKKPEHAYVCWLDVMGARSYMKWSDRVAATVVFKLHNAVIRGFTHASSPDEVRLYPVMDGTFLTSSEWTPLLKVLVDTMRLLSGTFLATAEDEFKFTVRGAISRSLVYHGRDVTAEADKYLANYPKVRDSVLIGAGAARAYEAEKKAGPFCIWRDDWAAAARSRQRVREIKAGPLRWFEHSSADTSGVQLLKAIRMYYAWYGTHGIEEHYPASVRAEHLALAEEQFAKSKT